MTWPPQLLSDLLSLEYGKALRAADRDASGNIPVAGSNGPDGVHSQALVEGPGIVVGRKGSAGKVVWYQSDFWPIDTTYHVRPKAPLNLRWTFYLLQNLRLERLNTTTGVPGLNRNDAYALKASYPPLAEQNRIVEILDQADELRRLRSEADAKAARILPALFMKMFGDPASWHSFKSSRPLGELVDLVSGATPSKGNSTYWEGEMPWVSPKDMKKDFIEDSIDHVSHVAVGESNLKLVEPGSVLLVVRGMILAHSVPVALTAVPLTINQDMKALVVKSPEMSGRYVWAALRIAKPLLRSLVRTAAHGTRKLDTPELLQVQLPTPDPVQLSACHSAVEAHRQMQQSVAASGEKIETLFSILLHRAFSGDLTASWREAHMKELLQEMEQQARLLGGSSAEVNT